METEFLWPYDDLSRKIQEAFSKQKVMSIWDIQEKVQYFDRLGLSRALHRMVARDHALVRGKAGLGEADHLIVYALCEKDLGTPGDKVTVSILENKTLRNKKVQVTLKTVERPEFHGLQEQQERHEDHSEGPVVAMVRRQAPLKKQAIDDAEEDVVVAESPDQDLEEDFSKPMAAGVKTQSVFLQWMMGSTKPSKTILEAAKTIQKAKTVTKTEKESKMENNEAWRESVETDVLAFLKAKGPNTVRGIREDFMTRGTYHGVDPEALRKAIGSRLNKMEAHGEVSKSGSPAVFTIESIAFVTGTKPVDEKPKVAAKPIVEVKPPVEKVFKDLLAEPIQKKISKPVETKSTKPNLLDDPMPLQPRKPQVVLTTQSLADEANAMIHKLREVCRTMIKDPAQHDNTDTIFDIYQKVDEIHALLEKLR